MSEERDRILKLLEEGKITADQAARLIQALGMARPPEPPPRPGPAAAPWAWHHRPHRRILVGELDRIPDIVAEAVSSAVKSGFCPSGETRTDFPGKSSLFLKSVSGNIELSGWDKERITLEGEGSLLRVRERDEQLMVRSISGDITGSVPAECRLELVSVSGNTTVNGVKGKFGLKSVSGDVDVSDFSGDLEIDSVSGGIRLKQVSGRLRVESKSGDIELSPAGEFSGEVVSKSGDIGLELGPDADVVLEMECEEDGEISVSVGFDHEILERGERSLRVRFGKGSRVLKLRTRKADIEVRDTKED